MALSRCSHGPKHTCWSTATPNNDDSNGTKANTFLNISFQIFIEWFHKEWCQDASHMSGHYVYRNLMLTMEIKKRIGSCLQTYCRALLRSEHIPWRLGSCTGMRSGQPWTLPPGRSAVVSRVGSKGIVSLSVNPTPFWYTQANSTTNHSFTLISWLKCANIIVSDFTHKLN